jgi:hypothetical protein
MSDAGRMDDCTVSMHEGPKVRKSIPPSVAEVRSGTAAENRNRLNRTVKFGPVRFRFSGSGHGSVLGSQNSPKFPNRLRTSEIL